MPAEIFDNLFVLDMANNHQGSLEHGLNIIREAAKVVKKQNVKAGIKFQYRDLDTFIHPSFKDGKENKHIPRFLGTRLKPEEFEEMANEVRKQGMTTICTPFDENSVDLIIKHRIDIIKIASCSARDWPLLEKAAAAKKPIICSTAGLITKELDDLASFFVHRKANFALMHCVAIYPTKNKDLALDRMDFLKNRYPFATIGFSTHEEPDNYDAVKMAIAKKAAILERHIGLETEKIKLNAYSSKPEQLEKWFISAKMAREACDFVKDHENKEEEESLNSLKRGVYARDKIKKGQEIRRKDVFFAMPLQEGQLESGGFKEGLLAYDGTPIKNMIKADNDYEKNEPINKLDVKDASSDIFELIHEVKGLLFESRTAIGPKFEVELSHQYGIGKVKKVGAVIIDVVNREYCKKIIVQIAGQYHPEHYHKLKEETFQVLYGDLIMNYGGKKRTLNAGEQIVIERGVIHSFTTKNGAVVEEISTTHHKNDSYYLDNKIAKDAALRKTKFNLW